MIIARNISAVILAAGRGKRMNADIPKAMHLLGDIPLIGHTIAMLNKLQLKSIIIVSNPEDKELHQYVQNLHIKTKIKLAFQNKPLGTGDALKSAMTAVDEAATPAVMVLPGDCPGIAENTIREQFYRINSENISIFTTTVPEPYGYGRIIRNHNNALAEIVEENDADELQKQITEINTGLYIFPKNFLDENLSKIKNNNAAKEFYLTDLIKIAADKNIPIIPIHTPEYEQFSGINTPEQLAAAQERLERR